MNHLIHFALATALTGCVIIPATKTTTESLGTKQSEPIAGATKGVKLSVESPDAEIVVRASYLRDCERRTYDVTRITTTKHAKLGGTEDPRGRAFGALIAPLTIPISAAITGLMVAGSAKVVRKETLKRAVTEPCPTVAVNLPVELVLASGRTLTLHTDERGMVSVAVPETEPYQGEVIARANGVSDRASYVRPRPALSQVRDATRSCAARHRVTGRLELRVTVDPKGSPTQIGTNQGTGELATCVGAAISKLRFPAAQRGATLVLPFQLDG